MLLRAAGARRFAWNWAVAKIKANADQWSAEATYGIDRPDRVRPLSFFTLAKLWTAEKPDVAPWAGEHSTWTFRYALRDAANAHAAFLAGKRRFPRFKARHRDRARFTVRERAGSGSWPAAAAQVRLGTHRRGVPGAGEAAQAGAPRPPDPAAHHRDPGRRRAPVCHRELR